MQKKIGIILVNYNGYEDTIECVKSIKKSTYRNYKIIIVDNASPDGSGNRLNDKYLNDSDIVVILNKENAGFSEGNNIGLEYIEKEKIDYILMLNNDTVVEPEFLYKLIEGARETNFEGLYSGKILYYFDKDRIWYAGGKYNYLKGTAIHEGVNENDDNKHYNMTKKMEFICGCCIFMNIDIYHQLGKLSDEYFLYAEDLDYSLTAQKLKIPMYYIPDARIYHKVSASTSKLSTLSQYYMIRNRFHIIRKFHRNYKKISAYIFTVLWCTKRIIRHEFSIAVCRAAITDFITNNMGKKVEKNEKKL